MKLDGTQFFASQKGVFTNYLKKTSQKQLTAKIIAEAVSNLFSPGTKLDLFCIGGGTGEADLGVVSLLPSHSFNIKNIDASDKMCLEYAVRARGVKNAHLQENKCSRFEIETMPANIADLIFCINTIYFLKGWRIINDKNPLLKIFHCLKNNGLAAIVVRLEHSDHYLIRKMAGAGHTSGMQVRKVLSQLKIPYYWELLDSEIDISDLFKNGQFEPNKQGNELLEFISKGKWKTFSKVRQESVIRLMQTLKIDRGKKIFLRSGYEVIWIRKESLGAGESKDYLTNSGTQRLAGKIRPLIRSIRDFPVKGIIFRDTSLLLQNPKIFREIINYAKDIYSGLKIDYIIAKDMQGVLWAGALAKELEVGIIPTFRKDIVPPVLTTTYAHEYNPERILNLSKEAIKEGDRVLIVDYMVATGATVLNMGKLVEHLGGKIVGVFSLMELSYLHPRALISNYPFHTIIKYNSEDEN